MKNIVGTYLSTLFITFYEECSYSVKQEIKDFWC